MARRGGVSVGDRTRASATRLLLVATLTALGCLLFGAEASAYVYWANEGDGFGDGTIARANLDGSAVVGDLVENAGNQPAGLAVDGSYLYWANSSGMPDAAIGRAALDGSGADPSFIPVTGTPASNPNGVAVDAEHVYWANADTGIGRANLDGTEVEQVWIPLADTPLGVAVNDSHVYWSTEPDTGSPGIGRATIDGVVTDPTFIVAGQQPEALALDDEHIYWADRAAGGGTIGRADLDGSDIDPSFIERGAGFPSGVAVDDQFIYWSNPTAGTIGRANLDGTGVDASFISTQPPEGAAGVAVDALVNPSATALACTPTTVMLPDSTTCTVTVSDPAGAGAGVPLGTVAFSASDAGTFAPTSGCALFALGPASSACRLTYTPRTAGPQTVTAEYAGVPDRHAPSTRTVIIAAKPQNSFSLGKAKRNRRRGTATLAVTVPGPGTVTMFGNRVKGQRKAASGAGQLTLRVRPNRKSRQRLARRGRTKVGVRVTYTPNGGDPSTQSKRFTLRKKRSAPRKHRRHRR